MEGNPHLSLQKDWSAEEYARNSTGQMAWGQELLAKLRIQGHESMLDIGCGDGKITARLSRLTTGTVLGIDLSQDMIRVAYENYPPADFPNLTFQRMDATDIRIPRGFDIAFSNAALHWVADHGAVLRGVHRCLKPGGKLLLQMGGRGNADDVFRILQEVVLSSRWRTYLEGFVPPYHFPGPELYETLLPSHGFRRSRIEMLPKDMEHQGLDGLAGWLRTTWFPYTDRLPVEVREEFLAEVVEAYTTAHPVDSSGKAHVRMVRLEVEACAL